MTDVVSESQHQKYFVTALGVIILSGTIVGAKPGYKWLRSRNILKRKEIAPGE
ncbi:hypothetical protein [Neobacillus drentensis]|uniref:hypothetical protein n=1 Tax=Neobacillus drentensis TaxID=220684 RepID=UPI002FFE351D